MSEEIILLSEFARRKGVALQTIKDKIRTGTITEGALMRSSNGVIRGIKVSIAEKDLLERGSAQNSMIAQTTKKKKSNVVVHPVAKPIETTEIIDGQEVPVTKLPEMDSDFSRYQKAKASSEELKARKLEIEMEELEGRLIDKNEVVKTVSKLTAEIKESFLNIPPKISAELLACKDIVELEVKLHKEINLVLEKLSRLENRYE